jgi:hypothetical protein
VSDIALAPQFALFRSYIKGVGFYAPPLSTKVTHSDGFEVLWPAVYGLGVRAVIKPEFLAWNSNRYTPDWIYSAYYAYFTANPTVHFTYLPFTSFAYRKPPYGNWYLTNHLDVWADFYAFDLPPAPPTYWHQLP